MAGFNRREVVVDVLESQGVTRESRWAWWEKNQKPDALQCGDWNNLV